MSRVGTGPASTADASSLLTGMLFLLPVSLVGNELGALFRYPEIGSAVLFPPYAALTAVLVVSPARHWIWYLLGAVATHVIAHWPQWTLSFVLGADVANTARALVAAGMLRWLFGGPPRLDGLRALALFIVPAVLVGPAVGATIGAANVVLHESTSAYWLAWRAWFMSNALTGLTMLPVFVIALTSGLGWLRHVERRRIVESLLLACVLAATCTVAFLLPAEDRSLALAFYAPLPALIWAALRFGAGGATLSLTAVVCVAMWGADRGTGPFAAWQLDERLLTLQFFVLLTAIPVLCIVAVNSARHRAVQLYRALLASLHDQVAILDARGDVLEASDSWRRCAEGARSLHRARIGDNYLDACREAGELGDPAAAPTLAGVTSVLARDRRRFDLEYEHEDGGHPESYTLSIEALERPGGGAVVTRVNVTARRRAQAELEEQRRELSHLARVAVLGQLSGALAHELNQPLMSILSNADAARRLIAARSLDVHQLDAILADIATEDRRAAQVIQRLRALLKRGDLTLQPIDPAELVVEVLELAHAELITRQVSVTSRIEQGLPQVHGDRVQLQQVLLNLPLNACEAMSSLPAIERRLVLRAKATAHQVQISIRDSGTGIPAALIDRLFEPFVTTKAEGLGLGLSIARTIVAAHGGRLWAENNEGGGATVHCLLPLAEVHRPDAEVPAAPDVALASSGARPVALSASAPSPGPQHR